YRHYPHQFSGGMRQRVVIALALAAEPRLLIADEPTTALDVSIQAQIIALLKRLAAERGAAVMLITHDMGVIAETANRVAVMYAGRVVEVGAVRDVIHAPQHPYTIGLMGSIPKIGARKGKLVQIDGAMPRLNAIPPGCAFNPRCPRRFDRCVGEPVKVLGTSVRVDEALVQVGLAPEDGDKYPHEFSGGQRQRISIARALAGEPDFLVCDEPTSALDVSVQAQILNLMSDLQKR